MDGSKVSIEMIIAPLKELITSPNVFGNKHTAAEIIFKTVDDFKTSGQN